LQPLFLSRPKGKEIWTPARFPDSYTAPIKMKTDVIAYGARWRNWRRSEIGRDRPIRQGKESLCNQ